MGTGGQSGNLELTAVSRAVVPVMAMTSEVAGHVGQETAQDAELEDPRVITTDRWKTTHASGNISPWDDGQDRIVVSASVRQYVCRGDVAESEQQPGALEVGEAL